MGTFLCVLGWTVFVLVGWTVISVLTLVGIHAATRGKDRA